MPIADLCLAPREPSAVYPARMPLRMGIVGARRSRQGIGEHVARHLAALRAEIKAIVGTRHETAEEARSHLRNRYGIAVRAHTSLAEMLSQETLDAIAICSPQEFHREHLQQALAARIHVLCEKPLVFNPGRDPVTDARPLVEGFAAAGKVLMVNEQWPYTLSAFQELHPQYPLGRHAPRELTVLLSPSEAGAAMIPNSIPHALSLLFALAPGGGSVEEIDIAPLDGERALVTAGQLRFDYRHGQGRTHVTVLLRRTLSQPRPAGYEIDGHAGSRDIDMPSYRMWLTASGDGTSNTSPRRVPLEDPLRLLLADFLNRCEQAARGAEFKKDTTLLERLAILRDIDVAARSVFAQAASKA